MKLHLLQ